MTRLLMSPDTREAWMELIDESGGKVDRGEVLARVYRHGGETVRIYVKRDSYVFQSYATASVLSRQFGWTTLAEDLPGRWHDGTPLDSVADGLAKRAAVILG